MNGNEISRGKNIVFPASIVPSLPLEGKATGARLRAGNVKCCPCGEREVLLRKVMFRLAK